MGHRLTSKPVPGDWNGVIHAIMRLDHALNTSASPIFENIGLSGVTENALLYADGDGVLTSLAAATNGQLIIGNTGNPPSITGLTGTANQVTVTPGAGSITLSTPQDIHTGASPTFAGGTFTGVVTGILPVTGDHLATKEYVDLAIGSELDFFLSDTDDGVIADTHTMFEKETGEAESTEVTPSLSQGDDQLIFSWLSEVGRPAASHAREGVYDMHVHLHKTGTKPVTIYWILSQVDADGSSNETVIISSETSPELTVSELVYDIHAVLAINMTTGVTKRLFARMYANVGATGSNPTVTVTMEGTTDSHVTIDVPSDVWQLRGDVLDDLNITGANSGANEFLVGTGAGALTWESGATARTSLGVAIGSDTQAWNAGLDSLAGLTYAAASFVKMTGANAFALRTIGETADDLEGTIVHDNLAGVHQDVTTSASPTFAGLKIESEVFIKEQAAADTDQAAYGQLWVKDDAPNTLWFTDDVGNDHPLRMSAVAETINLLDSDSTAQQQAKIDAVNKYIPAGTTVLFQFETNNTHVETAALEWVGFYGGGIINVHGDISEADATILHTSQNTIIDTSATSLLYALHFINCQVTINVLNLKITSKDASGQNASCIRIDSCVYRTTVWYCYLLMDGIVNNSTGVKTFYVPVLDVLRTYFSNMTWGIRTNLSRCYSNNNDDTGTQPKYGLYATGASTIGKNGTQPAGSTANELTAGGGVIR